MNIAVKLISTADLLYKAEQDLRNRILLRPVGVTDHGWEMHDEKALHFAAIDHKKLIGCVLLVPLDPYFSKTRLIQMAVETEYQGKGIGGILLQKLIEHAKQIRAVEIEIHARNNVVSFYEKYGFEVYGALFTEVGIKHRHMRMRFFDFTMFRSE